MYDELVAYHYAAFRPPLHEAILGKALDSSHHRHIGLDIGCGTGKSSEALQLFCSHVVGIDLSMAMLSQAVPDGMISYLNASAEQIPVAENSIDVVTVAGSLNYINRDKLINELRRICKPDAEILIYDFKVDLSGIKECLEIEEKDHVSSYDHTANLSGISGLNEIVVFSDHLILKLKPVEIWHLLLSGHGIYRALQTKYQSNNPDDSLLKDLEAMKTISPVNANIYYYKYML